MGKDNVVFHTLFFPGYLIGTHDKWTKLDSISTTEYLNYEGTKFSKSRGVGVFGENAKETGIPPDVWRYFLISNRPETGDSQFTWKAFIAGNNSELLANLGNLVNRVVKFVGATYEGVLPEGEVESGEAEQELKKDIDANLQEYTTTMESMRMRYGLEVVMRISARGNAYLQANRLDNRLYKEEPAKCATTALTAINLIYLLSVLVHPFMPATEASILKQLAAPARSVPASFSAKDILPGHKIGKAAYLFKQIDPKMEEVWKKQFGDKTSAAAAGGEEDGTKKSKRKAAKQAKAEEKPAYTGPKTEELLQKEKEVAQQAEKVRDIKSGKEKGEVGLEVAQLVTLKKELGDIVERLKSVQVTEALE